MKNLAPSSTPSSSSATTSTSSPVLEDVKPKTLTANVTDIDNAKKNVKVAEKPVAASKSTLDDLSRVVLPEVDVKKDPSTVENKATLAADTKVLQFDKQLVAYDKFSRPVLSNPYNSPMKIVYVYDGAPTVVEILPFSSVVLNVAKIAAYSFTAIVADAANTARNIAVGNFLGGGYEPAIGQPPPPPPPVFNTVQNVPVQVKYTGATYQPFRVKNIVDLGIDPIHGERKVLLDGTTPAWGTWAQSPTGAQQFEIHKTQQLPGLTAPAQAPLPGGYDLKLLSSEAPSGTTPRDVYLIVVVGIVAVLGLGGLVLGLVMNRRRQR